MMNATGTLKPLFFYFNLKNNKLKCLLIGSIPLKENKEIEDKCGHVSLLQIKT